MGLTVNDVAIIKGELNLSLNGIWYADLRLTASEKTFSAGDSVTIKSSDSKFSLKGTVAQDRVGEVLGSTYLRIIGGKGGMAKQATPKAFQNGLVSDVLNSLKNDSGETLSSTIDQSLLNKSLSNWTIFQSPVSYQLNILTKEFGWNWRFLEDGTLWVGVETYPTAPDFPYTMMDYDPINGYTPLAVASPILLPGYTLDGYKASKVIHELNEMSVRTKIYQPQTSGDRSVLNATNAIINSRLAPIDFFALYTAKVVSQSSDLKKVDIQPDDSRLPGMQGIPFASNLAGTTVQLSNAKVILGWSSGDPTQPYCFMQAGQSEIVQKITISDQNGDQVVITNGTVKINVANTTWINAASANLTLGTNPVTTPVLSVGAVDSLGVAITPAPTCSNTVLVG